MATATEILAAIDTAILDILTSGQDVMFNGRRYTKANLNDLRIMRAEYAALVTTSSSGGIFDRAKTGAVYRGA
jgi:hypothetical protein